MARDPAGAAPAVAPGIVPVLDPEMMERLEALEAGMSGLKNVQDLSELLSTKYNPFLDLDEDAFEGKYSAGDLIRAQAAPKRRPVWAQSSPGFDDALGSAFQPPPPMPAYAPPSQPMPAAPVPPAPAPVTAPAPLATAPPPMAPAPAPDKPGPRFGPPDTSRTDTMYAGSRHTATARESFLAMHWFTYLSEGTSPSIIFLYLDYYHYVGWIDAEAHAWLVKLAEGVATAKPDAKWEDFGMDVQKLSSRHLRNLRFIDKLLGTTLQHGEADYLRQTADMLLMED